MIEGLAGLISWGCQESCVRFDLLSMSAVNKRTAHRLRGLPYALQYGLPIVDKQALRRDACRGDQRFIVIRGEWLNVRRRCQRNARTDCEVGYDQSARTEDFEARSK